MPDPAGPTELSRQSYVRNLPRWRRLRQAARLLLLLAAASLVAWATAAVTAERPCDLAWSDPAPPQFAVATEVPPPADPAPAPVVCPPAPPPPPAWPDGVLGPCTGDDTLFQPPVPAGAADDDSAFMLDYQTLVGAAAAPERHGLLAAWSETSIWASSDDGRTFVGILDGPGAVQQVAIDCHGRVFALREGGRLGVRDGNREVWRDASFYMNGELADDRPVRLAAEGGSVALVGPVRDDINDGMLAVSSDAGATWRFVDLDGPGSWEGTVDLAIDTGGVVRVLSRYGDCMSEDSMLLTLDPASGRVRKNELDPYFWRAAITSDGWVHADGGCQGDGPCAFTPSGRARQLARPRGAEAIDDSDADPDVLHGRGDVAFARFGGTVLRLERGKVRMAGDGAQMDVATAVDHEGRLLGVADGDLVRWSPRRGTVHLPLRKNP